MRVIAGRAKGKKLKAPAGLNTRPITDRIKEALFNVLGSDIADSRVLDLFAGSGSVGIEALSRRAEKVVFIDAGGAAVKIIRENLDNCGMSEGFEIYRNDVFRAMNILQVHGEKFDYIYADPPFTNEIIFDQLMIAMDKADILKDDGIFIIRSQKRKEMPVKLAKLEKYRVNNYGESTLHYYCLREEDPGL